MDIVKRRDTDARTSQSMGVYWRQDKGKWVASCKGTYLGYHVTVWWCRLTHIDPRLTPA